MTDKLKQCPFCGSGDLGSGGDDKVVGYWCKNCQATGPNHYGKHEWNDRADSEALKAADENLVKRLKALQTYFDLDEEELASLTKDERADTLRQHRLITEALSAYNEKRGERE